MTKLCGWKTACALLVLCATAVSGASAQTFTTLATFDGTNGNGPDGSFVQGLNGNFYGATVGGGTGVYCPQGFQGCGTVFEITPLGKLRTLYNFCSQPNCSDGAFPNGGLAQANNGKLYGTTSGDEINAGTVFGITPAGILTTLYSFCSQRNCTDGLDPIGGLVQAINGNFYGTTSRGGAIGGGTVFEITPAGKLTTLHTFNGTDGGQPLAALAQAANGHLYGTTNVAGSSDLSEGTVFEITPAGILTTLYSFCAQPNCTDGSNPHAGVVQATNTNLYGTTVSGGTNCEGGCGTIFQITPAGKFNTLYSFCSQPNCGDGLAPDASLVQATDANLYGTAFQGGANFGGTVYEITTSGQLTTLYSFCAQPNCTDGELPYGLVQGTNGNLYGITALGGDSACSSGCGTVFSLDLGFGPFLRFVPPAGKVGQTGGILGQGFTGTTSVSLNGVPASFAVRSDTYIIATVPAGATTGYVTVTTPSGTLTSNVPFHVIP